jgi:hypothetical protein
MYKLTAEPKELIYCHIIPAPSCYEFWQENYQMFGLREVTCWKQ